jgi:hypothetical protein
MNQTERNFIGLSARPKWRFSRAAKNSEIPLRPAKS